MTVAGIVLAAGRSSRMAPRNKLLAEDSGRRTMIARVVDTVLGSQAWPVIVVTGHQPEAIRRTLAGRPVRFVHAEEYALGLSASLKAGIAAVPEECEAAMVCLGDMPLLSPPLLDSLLAAYDRTGDRLIVAPSHGGRLGNPVLWDRRFFSAIMGLTGDAGARALLASNAHKLALVETEDEAVLRDFDIPEELAALTPARHDAGA